MVDLDGEMQTIDNDLMQRGGCVAVAMGALGCGGERRERSEEGKVRCPGVEGRPGRRFRRRGGVGCRQAGRWRVATARACAISLLCLLAEVEDDWHGPWWARPLGELGQVSGAR